ncbi:oligosaccharide flippase family protein [Chitinispirillales bacterium ANBcel5]|uniref:lipopolysaccharide biosynthesis protein n=1 Tax=Cellulosispirillum alkaliphilum TaxID=3039283 RepID=UPI002A552600|nr:oligosaccharide flippase family protein [Chitinispirillales bacterium ANBcel5]
MLQRLLKNSSVLLCGNLSTSLLGLVSIALIARSLGTEQFGLLIYIITYVHIIDRLVNFQSWQAIVKYGTDCLNENDNEKFKYLVKFGFALDIVTAVAGTLIAIISINVLAMWGLLDKEFIFMAVIYSFTIIFHINGTPIAILRIFDKFKYIAFQNVLSAVIKLFGVAVAFSTGAGLWTYVIILAAVEIIGNIITVMLAYRELMLKHYHRVIHRSISIRKISEKHKGIWEFLWTTNIHSSVKLGLKELDIIIVGIVLGYNGAGLYKIVKSIGSAVGSLTGPMYQAIYPDLTRCVSSRRFLDLKNLIIKPMKFVGVISVVVLILFSFFGEYVIVLLLDEEYREIFTSAQLYLVGTLLSMVTFAFHPTLLSFGRAKTSLYILVINTLLYIIFVFVFTRSCGLQGAALAYILFYVSWSFFQAMAIRKCFKKKAVFK